MLLLQSFVERLRPLVGSESWDYIVIWKLSDDQRCIEYMCCCCAGSERGYNNGEQGLLSFPPSSPALPCRDFMFPHHRMGVCDLLDQLPTSVALDSGMHADAVLSNQVTWLNCSQNSDSGSSQDMIGTRVLIPLSLGLIELFVNKQVPEDQQVLNLIMAESNFFLEQQKMTSNSDSFSTDPHVTFHHQIPPEISKQNMDLPQDISIGRIHLRSPTDLNNNAFETEQKNRGIFSEEATLYGLGLFAPSFEDGFREAEGAQSRSSSKLMQDEMNDDSFLCENYKSDHSDPIDDEDEVKHRRRSAKGPSKNLKAERNRRKKLNERLYALRSLVPNISKLDRASILGDAIKYVRELQEQEKELQMELEENSDDEDARKTGKNTTPNAVQTSNTQGLKRGQENLINGFHKNYNANIDKLNHEAELIYDKVQQMEPQVEVFQLDGNEFFIKVFCEHRSGGFERLMQALNTLGLEVTNANSSRHTCLVSSSFIVEQKNQDSVQADMVKESLLELTRNPSRIWSNAADELQNGEPVDDDDNFVDHEFSENSLFPTLQANHTHGLQNSVYN